MLNIFVSYLEEHLNNQVNSMILDRSHICPAIPMPDPMAHAICCSDRNRDNALDQYSEDFSLSLVISLLPPLSV